MKKTSLIGTLFWSGHQLSWHSQFGRIFGLIYFSHHSEIPQISGKFNSFIFLVSLILIVAKQPIESQSYELKIRSLNK